MLNLPLLFIISDTGGDDSSGDFEGAGDAGGAGHVRNGGLAGDESGGGEIFETDGEVSLGAFFVESEVVDADGGVFVYAVSVGVFDALKFGKIGKVAVVLVENNIVGVHFEKSGLGIEVVGGADVLEGGGDEVSKCGDMDGEVIEGIVR